LVDTPWEIESADYWACWPVTTQECAQGKRIDVVFELHDEKVWQKYKHVIKQLLKKNPDMDFYMLREYKEIPRAKSFPLGEIQDSINNIYMKRYFTSTIAYMIAYAIYKGYKTINLHGIALSVEEEEYSMQRSCAEAWLAYGIGKGCTVNIAQPSSLMLCNYMYGYEGDKDVSIKLSQTKEGVIMALEELEEKKHQAEMELEQQRGALNMMNILQNDIFRGL